MRELSRDKVSQGGRENQAHLQANSGSGSRPSISRIRFSMARSRPRAGEFSSQADCKPTVRRRWMQLTTLTYKPTRHTVPIPILQMLQLTAAKIPDLVQTKSNLAVHRVLLEGSV